jgi:hypothetical protein
MTRYVRPATTGKGWEIVKEGHRRATARASTKAAAIADARTLVRREGGGEIRVMNRDGKLTDASTVVSRARHSRAS